MVMIVYNDRTAAKLTKEAVAYIRDNHHTHGNSPKQLAELFGVSPTTVGQIIRCETWRKPVGAA